MSTAHLHIDSFNAGEISPLASSRFGVEKVASGCRVLRNFIIHPHGPAFRRPGMEYLDDAASNTYPSHLRSFQFSSSTVFVLELSAYDDVVEGETVEVGQLQVWQNGAKVGDPVPMPYTSAEMPEVQMSQINDVVYLTHPNHEPRRLTRYADDDWRMAVVPWKNPPLLDENPAETPSYSLCVAAALTNYGHQATWTEGSPSQVLAIGGTIASGPHRLILEEEVTVGVWREVYDLSWFGTPIFGMSPVWNTGPVTNLRRITYYGPSWPPYNISAYISVGGTPRVYATPPGTAPPTGTAAPGIIKLTLSNLAQSGRQAKYLSLQYRIGGTGEFQVLESWDMRVARNLVKEFVITASTEYRFISDAATTANGTPTIKLEFAVPASQAQTAVQVSNAGLGSGHTMLASRALFRTAHIGSYWQLTHLRRNEGRDDAFVQLTSTSAATAATGVLSISGQPALNETVTIGSRVYQWVTTAAATAGQVEIGANQATSVNNLAAAINAGPGSGGGTLYGSQTAPHADVTAVADTTSSPMKVTVTARTPGIGAHSVYLTDTMTNGIWDQVFMHGGVAKNTVITAAATDGVRVNGTWEVTTYGSWATTLYLERLTASGAWEYVRSWRANKDRNVSATGTTEGEETLRLRILDGTAEETSTAASPRFLLEAVDARVNGLVKITGVGALNAEGLAVTATCDVVQACWDTSPTYVWTEGAFSEHQGYPRAVTFHESRLWFGGTARQPMRLWGSVTGDIENFARTGLDDGGVSFTPNAGELNPVQWMQSQGSDLIVATAGDEWTVSGEGKPITPGNVAFRPQSRYGSSVVPGIMAGEVVAFVQRGGRKVRRIANRSDNTPWATADMTVLAEHIALGGIKQLAYSANPNAILWAVTNDGALLGLSIEVEQNVFGWHRHDTYGLVESVAVVYGATADEVWISVRRGWKRTIERLDPQVFNRSFSSYHTMMYSDCAKRQVFGSPVTTVPNLGHLEGHVVCVLADGVERPMAVVSGSQITLSSPATTVVVGLPYTSTLQPSRREIQTEKGTAQGLKWRPSRAVAYLHESRGGKVLSTPGGREELLPYPAASGLYSGPVETAMDSNASPSVDVLLQTESPLPFNVGALVLKLDVYGD